MFLIKAILLTLSIYSSLTAIFITPAYPPIAEQNQYYSVVFRIRGADFPVFRFSGLPKGIVGNSDGKLSGIPT